MATARPRAHAELEVSTVPLYVRPTEPLKLFVDTPAKFPQCSSPLMCYTSFNLFRV